jgi:predicted RND superfamily exporter protein
VKSNSLESICFAILIGISCDFVIHFSHAYASLPGNLHRHARTKHALISMGPSILAAAFTTLAAATIMLFCVISFFVKFAIILFLTIVQATAGSFVVFLVLTDCFGPSQPTFAFDWIMAKFRRQNAEQRHLIEPHRSEGVGSKPIQILVGRADGMTPSEGVQNDAKVDRVEELSLFGENILPGAIPVEA